MMSTRIGLSLIAILATAGMMAGATFAFFSDVSNSTNNTFNSATFNLTVADNSEGFKNNISQSFVTPANWAPGDTYTDFVCFKNEGSIPIQQILFKLSSPDTTVASLASAVRVKTIELGPSTDGNCNTAGAVGSESLTDFTPLFNTRFGTNTPLSILLTTIDGTDQIKDDLLDGVENALAPNSIVKLRIQWEFDPAATSAVAGQTVHADIQFKATQEEVPSPTPTP